MSIPGSLQNKVHKSNIKANIILKRSNAAGPA